MPNWDNWLNDLALCANWIIYVGSFVLLLLAFLVPIAIIVYVATSILNTHRISRKLKSNTDREFEKLTRELH